VIRAGWQVRIDRPREQVFDFVADPANASVWSTDPGRYELTTELSDRPEELVFLGLTSGSHVRIRFRFTPVGDAATDVSCELALTLKGLARGLEPLMAGIAKRGVEESRGPALKAALERP
jgi:hypothetical protein